MAELKKFEWKCPHPGCIYSISAYSDSGLKTMRGFHEDVHKRERDFVLGTMPAPPKDINKLDLTVADKAFLKTRGIRED
jgi:hypothetical protein